MATYPIRQKSLQSFDAGEFLLKNKRYDLGVYASYKAVMQLFSHIVNELKGIPMEELHSQMNYRPSNVGTHDLYSQLVIRRIERESRKSYRELRMKFKDLKNLRIQADYSPEMCQERECKRALSLATDIWNELKRYYQIGGMLI